MYEEEQEQETTQQEEREVSMILGPVIVLAAPFTYLFDNDEEPGATDVFVEKGGAALRIRLDKEALTEMPKAGDVLIAETITHDPSCGCSHVHNAFFAIELWKIENGRAISLYNYCRTESETA